MPCSKDNFSIVTSLNSTEVLKRSSRARAIEHTAYTVEDQKGLIPNRGGGGQFAHTCMYKMVD